MPRITRRMAWRLAAGAVLVAVAVGIWAMRRHPGRTGGVDVADVGAGSIRSGEVRLKPDATYVTSQTCATCHPTQAAAWRDSQHARAMAEATEQTVLGKFNTSTFFKRDGAFYVRTDGPDGRQADFPIAYTFGVAPLQQYLIRLPGGRLQALGMAWDSRPASSGGQRWFDLYPSERLKAGDPLHWTGLHQNWNFMCADCHSTHLQKGYDPVTREFQTTWSEISVGCEACHGPGSRHVETKGKTRMPALLDEHKAAVANRPPPGDREVAVCARCHSRRSQLTDNAHAGDPFEDKFRPVLLEPALFYSDGQQQDEVYNYASFVQSKMHAKGVTCADCHDPHSGRTRFQGNALCTQCHVKATFDAPAHHFHRPGTPSASCVSCHMPTTTYMQIDPRHDHSFKVPRPEETAKSGAPNACTMACHSKSTSAWAAAEIARRRSTPAAASGSVVASGFSRTSTAIVRATAIARMDAGDATFASTMAAAVADPSPMVRRAALTALSNADPELRLRLAPPLLADPVRTVRAEAVHCLLEVADQSLSGPSRADFDRAFDEFLAEQRFNADRPEAQTTLGTAWLTRGRADLAIPALTEAIRLDPTFVPAYVNLADAYQSGGNESSAERVLRDGLRAAPAAAVLHHALGLALVRQKQIPAALKELAEAVRLDPDASRFTYTYIVALHDTGKPDEAVRLVKAFLRKHPGDAAIRSLETGYAR